MKLTWKDLIYFILICGLVSAVIYIYVGSTFLAVIVWGIYGGCLLLGGFFEYMLSKRISPLHMQILVGWIIYLFISLSVTLIDFYMLSPPLMEALHFNYPLSFSLAVWVFYGIIMVLFTLGYYFIYTSCPGCRGIITRWGNYCNNCGFYRGEEEVTREGVEQ
ncbi:MAG: hypothetical protein D5R97_06185 [Candidatus Syntrophonatronum acetioxidans]|uniref:Uncharacterized protein n=1 Tax=Candidatus Syntrophonatronum acetioxidans TaxID=1795816 RepID=A0A424YDS6_9FIRM|nr:MAG: hypothetical protein D5R97_06185 [Candidatus Syntrophonatronum acetioxidans]